MISSRILRCNTVCCRNSIFRVNGLLRPHYQNAFSTRIALNIESENNQTESSRNNGGRLSQTIWMNDRGIGAQGAITMAKTLNWENIRELHLGGNQIGNRGTVAIAKSIGGCLEKLSLYNNNIGVVGAQAITDAVSRTKKLKTLWIHDNQFGNEGVSKIAGVAFSLQELWLGDNMIGEEGMQQLAKALDGPASLQSLWLHNNEIGDEGVVALAQSLHQNTNIRMLCFSDNCIGAIGGEALGEALLKGNIPLQELKLKGNKVGDTGAKALARSLKTNMGQLIKLNLSDNNIGPEGAIALAEAMEVNTKLYELCVRGNSIGKEGAAALSACRNSKRVIYL